MISVNLPVATDGTASPGWHNLLNEICGVNYLPVGRLGTGEDVAAVVVMLAANAYMTGQTVQVNGGLHYN